MTTPTPVTQAEVEALEALLAALPLPLRYDDFVSTVWGRLKRGGDDFYVADLRGFGRLLSDAGYDEERAAKEQDEIGEALVATLNAMPRLLAALRAQDAGVLAERDKARAQNAALVALLAEVRPLVAGHTILHMGDGPKPMYPVTLALIDAVIAAGVAALKSGGGA